MESPAQRRLKAIQSHLLPSSNEDSDSFLLRNLTASQFFSAQKYSVILPEKLNTGKWNVYRSARLPLKLVSRFPDHPEIGTLHDNFVHSVETFRDYKYLGTRIRVDGTVGGYKWMTYGEVATAREAIGSGLRYHGMPQGSCVGLYFINRPEWVIADHACFAYSYISVPLYDTLGPDAVRYVVNHADVQTIFCVPQSLNTGVYLQESFFHTRTLSPKNVTIVKFVTIVIVEHLALSLLRAGHGLDAFAAVTMVVATSPLARLAVTTAMPSRSQQWVFGFSFGCTST